MNTNFVELNSNQLLDVNGGGLFEAIAVTVIGVAIIALTVATVPAATPFVAKALIVVGGGMVTSAGAVMAYNN